MGIFLPERYVAAVDRIDLGALWDEGVRLIMLDRDNTLVPYGAEAAPDSVAAWLAEARERGFELYMVSNNWHFKRVRRTAAELGLKAIGFACKPLPFALLVVRHRVGVGGRAAVMVGDQLYTDIWAGKLAGARTVLVRPQCSNDIWYTRIFRLVERLALSGMDCEA